MAPIWDSLAETFAAEPDVLVAKVDAEAKESRATAESQKVASYPTIKYFPKGSTEPAIYQGARTERAFVTFINEKTGTDRVPGGGLGAKAGTIEAVDTILAKYITAGGIKDVEQVTAEITNAIQETTNQYAEYYVKVLQKLVQDPDYVKNEETRLAGLLKKGGLAQEKIDDMTSRSNILKKFLVKPEVHVEL